MAWLESQTSQHALTNQRGGYMTLTAIAITVMFGLTAFGIEVGRWYAIQGELGKSIDGAAFAGAQNVNNPHIADFNLFVEDVANANFPPGMLGTDTPNFSVSDDGNGKISVNGFTNSLNTFGKAINTSYDKTKVATSGSARLRNAEIALVLDISGSMDGTPITRLKEGAETFVENFEDQETKSKFALLSFASGVIENFDLDHNYVNPITNSINGMNAVGGTNSGGALAEAAALPWKDQSSIPVNERDKQVVVFFSDGNPTAFTDRFRRNGTWYDAAVPDGSVSLREPDDQHDQISNYYAWPSGNGTGNSGTGWSNQCGGGSNYERVKWEIFEDPTYGVDSSVYPPFNGMDPETCFTKNQLKPYVTAVARQKAIDNAAAIKAAGIEIYTIGLGNVDQALLESLSSGPEFAYYTADPAELEGIFQKIANVLKLILVS